MENLQGLSDLTNRSPFFQEHCIFVTLIEELRNISHMIKIRLDSIRIFLSVSWQCFALRNCNRQPTLVLQKNMKFTSIRTVLELKQEHTGYSSMKQNLQGDKLIILKC